jgi:hypothetical protein
MLSFLKSDGNQGVFFIHEGKGTEERASTRALLMSSDPASLSRPDKF